VLLSSLAKENNEENVAAVFNFFEKISGKTGFSRLHIYSF